MYVSNILCKNSLLTKMKFVKYFLELFKTTPKNIYEENTIILKPMLYFSAIPIIKNEAVKIDLKYLIFPFISASLCFIILLYLFTSKYLEQHFILKLLQNSVMYLQLSFGTFCLISIYIAQYIQKAKILYIFQQLNSYDKYLKSFNIDYDLNNRKRVLCVIFGYILHIINWCFTFIHILLEWEIDIIIYITLFFIPSNAMLLILYLYMSLVYSITQRFVCTSKYLLKLFEVDDNTKIKTSLNHLLDLCEILTDINTSYGKLIFIAIKMIFVWTISDLFSIIYNAINEGWEKSIWTIIAYSFLFIYQWIICLAMYICGKCSKQVIMIQ